MTAGQRVLFVVPPLLGHLQPARAIAGELQARGHEIAWVGSLATLRPVLGEQATIYRTGSRIHRPQADRGLASIRSLWAEFIVSYTRFIRPAVARAVADFGPDVIVTDQHAPAGAIVATAEQLPWASVACSSIELLQPFRSLPGVRDWLAGQRAALATAAGLDADFDFRFSEYATLSLTSPALTGPLPPAAGPVYQVGPCLGPRWNDPDFDWDWLDGRPAVLVSVGTLAAGLAGDFYQRVLAALGGRTDLQVIVVADPETLPEPPANVLVRARVPMLRLMPRLSAVISHGGLNTVSEALSFGVPLVLAPIRHDQPLNAGMVCAAGAGLRVNFVRASPEQLRAAVLTVLTDARYRTAAEVLAADFRAAGGCRAAAELVEGLTVMAQRNQALVADRPA